MQKSRYAEEQIAFALKRLVADSGSISARESRTCPAVPIAFSRCALQELRNHSTPEFGRTVQMCAMQAAHSILLEF